MRQVVIKGDEYKIWDDTYNDPKYKNPPKNPPFKYDPLYKVEDSEEPDDGDEFVFCDGKPIVTSGEAFAKTKKEEYSREWEEKEEPDKTKDKDKNKGKTTTTKDDNKPKKIVPGAKKEDKKNTEEVTVKPTSAADFVFADGEPFATHEGGVIGEGGSYAEIDGEIKQTDKTEVSGKFTKNNSNLFIDG